MTHAALGVVGLLLIASAACAESALDVSPVQIKSEIQVSGAREVLLKYYDTPTWSASIMPGIKSAAPVWLGVGEQLKSAADGAASEDLGVAFYDALAVAPFRVLPVLLRVYGGSIEKLCTVSFEAEEPNQGADAYLQSIREKLGSPEGNEQRAMAAECLRGLEQSKAASPH